MRRMTLFRLAAAVTVAAMIPCATQAQTPGAGLVERLAACRAVAVDVDRLACFDAAVGALETARAEGQVVILDREEVEETRRRTFGLDINALNPFARDGGVEEIDQVTGTLGDARQFGAARSWLFTLEDGSVWRQIDDDRLRVDPRAGMTVEIRRASMGSYLMSIDGARSVRVRRDR
jgi:hypothetical protein